MSVDLGVNINSNGNNNSNVMMDNIMVAYSNADGSMCIYDRNNDSDRFTTIPIKYITN